MARSTVYRRLAASERAGIPIRTSLATIVAQGAEGRAFAPVLDAVNEGVDLGEAAARSPDLEGHERSLLRAGSRAGRLPEAFERLADLFEERAKARRKLAGALAYPVFLMHLAMLLPNVTVLVTDGALAFAAAAFIPLAIAWGVVLGGAFAMKAARQANALAVDRVLLGLPVLGQFVHRSALALSLGVMRGLVESGVSVIEAVDAAREACPNVAVARFFADVKGKLDRGEPVDTAFAAAALEHRIPPVVVDYVSTGSKTGQLDAMLARAATMMQDEASTYRNVLIVGAGGMAFVVAAGLVAWKVIGFWLNYANQLGRF